jgi:hypothetical protein
MFDSLCQLDDPYTTENMQRAVDSIIQGKELQLSKITADNLKEKIKPNYQYVRFLPKGSSQKSQVRRLGLTLFDYPLDYKEENRWKGYIDKSLGDSVNAYYTSVPIDFVFPIGIKYKIIKKLFIPQPIEAAMDSLDLAGGPMTKLTSSSMIGSLVESINSANISLFDLENYSRKITGNSINTY